MKKFITSKGFKLFLKAGFYTLCAISLLVIGYFSAMYFFTVGK